MQNKPYTSLLIILFLLPVCSLQAEDIFKWTDENGKTHFGSNPPDNKKANKLNVTPINSIKMPKHQPKPHFETQPPNTKSQIPSQKYTSFYKNNEIKYSYRTRNGNRVNPTIENYNTGELKQKWAYPDNLLKEPIHVKGHLTITKVSIVKEHRDSLILKITYELFKNNKKSWLHFRPKPAKYFNKKKLLLKSGKNTEVITKTLSLKAPSTFQSANLLCRFYDGYTREWKTIGDIDLIKIWHKNY